MFETDRLHRDLLEQSRKTLQYQEYIQETIRRYLEGMLFVYFDQLQKREEFADTFHSHMLVLGESFKQMISSERYSLWIDKISNFEFLRLSKHQEINKVKKEVEGFFDEGFFALLDELDLEEILSINSVIDGLLGGDSDKDEVHLSKNVDSYLEQFLPGESHASSDENYKG